MTGQELVTHLRESVLDDNTTPYLWTDSELLRYLNYSEVQACRRAHLIIDGTTASDSGTGVWSLGTGGTRGTGGEKSLCSLTIVASQATYNLSPKILQVKRCQLKSMTYPITGPVAYPELDDLMSGWFGTAGTVCGNDDGEKATGTITSSGTNVGEGEAIVIDTKTYTFRGTVGTTEGNVHIGATAAATLDNLKAAINHTGTANTDYYCAAAHTTVSATTNTDTVQTIEALLNGIAGNDIALTTTASSFTLSGALLTGGVDDTGNPSYFLNEPGNTITFVLAPSTADTAYLVVSRIPLIPFTLTSSPEIEEKYHEGLMDWAAHLAYMKNDSDTLNLNLAKVYEEKFIRTFGTLPDAYSDRMRKTLSQKQRMRSRTFGS